MPKIESNHIYASFIKWFETACNASAAEPATDNRPRDPNVNDSSSSSQFVNSADRSQDPRTGIQTDNIIRYPPAPDGEPPRGGIFYDPSTLTHMWLPSTCLPQPNPWSQPIFQVLPDLSRLRRCDRFGHPYGSSSYQACDSGSHRGPSSGSNHTAEENNFLVRPSPRTKSHSGSDSGSHHESRSASHQE